MLSSYQQSSFFVQNFSLLLFFLQIELFCHNVLCLFGFYFYFLEGIKKVFLGYSVLVFLVVVSSQIIKGFFFCDRF